MEKKIENIKKDINNYLSQSKNIQEEWIEDNHPIDIAEALSELEASEINNFTKLIETEDLADIFEESEKELQIDILKCKSSQEIIEIFSHMAADDITDILGLLPIQKRKKLLRHMKQDDALVVKNLLGYDKESAGGIMTTEYLLLNKNLTTTEALKKLKNIAPDTEIIDTIFISDDNKKLVGSVDLRDILSSDDNKILEELMDDNIVKVTADVDQEIVAQQVAKYDLTVIPVINNSGILIGIITVDDIIDVIEAENTEDLYKMHGVDEEESSNATLMQSVQSRLPWMFINLATAFLATFTVAIFEDVISQVVALAAAMPIVAGMGGNAGTQTLSIVIRGIALGEIDFKDNWKLLFKEAMVGIINGTATGLVTGLILYLMYGNYYLGLIIFLAMILNLLIAGMFGFLIPLSLQSLGIDPALASAIFVTTVTDVFGFFVFLGLAKTFLIYLI
ncbi:magnesium transporter [Halanaerobium congolense]|jgi:magnesium transporter|uniref:Magnesium transporter MgtE n=1 Tax=Halanaerobium congolense TaxID=54121 RepID=A0A1G6MCB6_9FIRM|nr:magnesium transporter [Halanaerobium congolense]KXS49993.1 MAG: magnesium transporter [Halanaerobium sp. T82-1]PUU88609.1 MAG: magnesium transporter [Halanaerobium sp.]SDC53248.1 magnesium transporter [Halanaerobium congolense]SDI39881.1 magnesium transporter [Halanaerobium congolense]SDK55294.1 magnesium transporter [Halanaerobium congolense]